LKLERRAAEKTHSGFILSVHALHALVILPGLHKAGIETLSWHNEKQNIKYFKLSGLACSFLNYVVFANIRLDGGLIIVSRKKNSNKENLFFFLFFFMFLGADDAQRYNAAFCPIKGHFINLKISYYVLGIWYFCL
jgi:hypothetical protein